MDYKILNGIRMQDGIPQMFVIRPNGDCGWNPVEGNKIKLIKYQDAEKETELDAENLLRSADLKKVNEFFTSKPRIGQADMNRIAGSAHIDLSDTFLYNLRIQGDFHNADFKRAHISECKIMDSDFINGNFTEATLSSVESVDSQIIHSNFTHAHLKSCVLKDTVLDSNNFSWSYFQQVSFGRYSVIKDNSFFHAELDQVNLGHADVRGENRHLDTIDFRMGGGTAQEAEAYKKRLLETLQNKKTEGIGDMPLKDIDWTKVDIIYQYENNQNIPDSQRVTEWFGDYGMAVPKPGVSLMKFEDRYEMAVYGEKWKEQLSEQEEAIKRAVEKIMSEPELPEQDFEMEMEM